MDKKVLFNETLTSLVEFAAVNGNQITMNDVKTYFKDLIEDDSQYRFIYDYLTINKITIDGYTPDAGDNIFSETDVEDDTLKNFENDSNILSDNTISDAISSELSESEEELAFIDMYMNEISDIMPASEDDISALVSQLLAGNLDVVNRLVECNLKTVADIACSFRNQGVTYGDLIQEGNLALMIAISDYSQDKGNFNSYIHEYIKNTLESIINSQINSNRINNRLADKLNQLDSVTKDLSETLGRVPDISELAEAMNITEDEASLLLKTSLDTLSVNEDTQITSDESSDDLQQNNISAAKETDPLTWRVNKK